MDNIGASIETLQAAIKTKLGNGKGVQPVVLPQWCPYRDLTDFFTDSDVKDAIDSWVLQHNPDHVVFLTEVDYAKLTIFINEIRIVNHEDVDLYNLESMIKTMTVGDSSDLEIYMDRFASSFAKPSGKMAVGANSDSEDDGDNDNSDAPVDSYYYYRSLMNEIFGMAYSMKVLISNISDWTIALRSSYQNLGDEYNKGDVDGKGVKASGKRDPIPLPINSSNVRECLQLVKSLINPGKDASSDKVIGESNSNKNNNKNNSGKVAAAVPSQMDDDDSDDDSDNDAGPNNNNNKAKKRKRRRGKA